MGRRKEPRIKMVLPAKLWTDAEGSFPLGQSCVTQNITRHGVCIEGVPSLKVGQIITLGYHQKKSRFRVAWIGAAGSAQARLAGLENLEPEKLIFGVGFPESPDEYKVPEPKPSAAVDSVAVSAWNGKERRACQRYNCSGTAEVREQGGSTFTSGKLADICMGGCYVEMMAPFQAGSAIELALAVSDLQIRLSGMVRVRHREGMGVQFTESAAAEQARLAQLIDWLAHGSVGSPSSAPPPLAASASAPAPELASLLEALQNWFGSHDTLTRDEFLSMLSKSRAAGSKS